MQHKDEVLVQLHAMFAKDEQATRCHHNYFTQEVTKDCRTKLVEWCYTVVDSFNLSRESVWRAMDILDRYLSSGKGLSAKALENKPSFQLACTVCLYIAVKVHEDVEMTIAFLVKLCQSYYTASEFINMEHDILFALQWSICKTTPLDFVKCLLLQSDSFDAETTDFILDIAQKQMDRVTSDVYFASCKRLSVGIVCLGAALVESDVTLAEQEEFWSQLSPMLNFDFASKEVREVERRMLSGYPINETEVQSKLVLSKTAKQKSLPNDEQISPVSIF